MRPLKEVIVSETKVVGNVRVVVKQGSMRVVDNETSAGATAG